MAEDQVRLEVEAERATAELQERAADLYLPLTVAAAITFHQVHHNTKAIVTRQDYDHALSIAAAALSRLIPIDSLRGRECRREPRRSDRDMKRRGVRRLLVAGGRRALWHRLARQPTRGNGARDVGDRACGARRHRT